MSGADSVDSADSVGTASDSGPVRTAGTGHDSAAVGSMDAAPESAPTGRAVVGVIMGSDSDWPVMSAAADILRQFEVDFEVSVVSAHRTPDRMIDYARTAADRGLRVIIAGAGGAAHLPGMVASTTVLPVIGVPVPLAKLDGLDSLLSIVQMPAGIPVATVSIGGAANAGLLAVRILASAPDGAALADRLAEYAAGLEAMVLEKDATLQRQLAD